MVSDPKSLDELEKKVYALYVKKGLKCSRSPCECELERRPDRDKCEWMTK
jgi:hypothetical protein